jgi:hypothetical protein
MPIGFALTFWLLFFAWIETISLVLWRKPSGSQALTLYFWLVLPTVVLAAADIFIRGSLRHRRGAVLAGAGVALAVFLVALFPLSWSHMGLLYCEWRENCIPVEQWNELKGVYSDAFAVLLLLIAGLDALGCLAWAILLGYTWLKSRNLQANQR